MIAQLLGLLATPRTAQQEQEAAGRRLQAASGLGGCYGHTGSFNRLTQSRRAPLLSFRGRFLVCRF
jgi:hypothetical protein